MPLEVQLAFRARKGDLVCLVVFWIYKKDGYHYHSKRLTWAWSGAVVEGNEGRFHFGSRLFVMIASISVCICSNGRLDCLSRCLASIAKSTCLVREVIVSEDG